jgi:zinc protease
VQSNAVGEAIREIDRELCNIESNVCRSHDEIARFKRYELFRLATSRETIRDVGRSIVDLLQFGLPLDYYEHVPEKVAALCSGDLEAYVGAVVHPGGMVWLIIGNQSRIEREIGALRIGESRKLENLRYC